MANLSNINNKFIVADVATATKVSIGITTTNNLLTLFGTGAGNATLQIEGEGGADPYINFLANNAQHWSLGIDDSDSDKFKLSEHSALGTNDYFVVDTSGNSTFAGNVRVNGWIKGASDTNTLFSNTSLGTLLQTPSNSGAGAVIHFRNASGTDFQTFSQVDGSATFAGNVTTTAGRLQLGAVALPSAGVAAITNRSSDNSLYIQTSSGNTAYLLDGSQNTMYSSASTAHNFYISNVPKLTIDSNGDSTFAGNVKIGSSTTGTPSTNADDLVIDKGASESGITLMSTAAASIRFGDAANTSIGSLEYNHNSNHMRMIVNNEERVRIDSSGNVGIGVTPNVNSSVVNVIQLGKGMTLMGNANDDRATMAANLYLDTGTAFRYVMDGLAGRFSIEDGNMVWGTASSGTAGTVATVYTKMTLLNNGNVGIGANSPAEKLHVSAGNIRLDSTVAGGNGILIIYDSSGTQSGQIYGSSGDLKIYSPADVLFNQGGNVGIGTDSPVSFTNQTSLTINGTSIGRVDCLASGGGGGGMFASSSQLQVFSNSGVNLQLSSAANIDFVTGSTDRMKITSGGNINIGSGGLTQTSYQLRVDSDFDNGIYLSAASGNDSALYIDNGAKSSELFIVRGDGNIKIPGIGVTATATAIGVDGSGFIRKLSSSKRYKKDIEPIDIGLDFIDSLSAVKFKMKEDDAESVGLIAENMIDNRFVTYSQIDMKDESKGLQVEGVNYQALIAPLIKSIQELKAYNDTLKARIETLENK